MPSQAKFWEVNAFLRLFVAICKCLGLWVEMAKFGSVPFSPNAKPEPGLQFSNLLNPEPELGVQFQRVRFRYSLMSHKDIMIETHEFWPSFGTPFTCQTHTKWVENFKDNSYYLPHIVKHMLSIVDVVGGKENQSKKKRVTKLKVQCLPQRHPIHSLTDWLLKPTRSLAIEWAGFPNPDMHGDEIKIMRVPVASGCTSHGFWEASLIPQFVS
ncbi:hypothetical protein DFH07DRAFT_777503 [Mycena maculata]|uniref:Uncharacterized protein n=1 Tax=Mycena maculata TaxID=230809 RepID=A0AAD7IJT3_9AGAR|nr:hypothetical protein DFH07DRAFT_777503 [Mycena maculata]